MKQDLVRQKPVDRAAPAGSDNSCRHALFGKHNERRVIECVPAFGQRLYPVFAEGIQIDAVPAETVTDGVVRIVRPQSGLVLVLRHGRSRFAGQEFFCFPREDLREPG
ncbi:hypothetical protein D3C73_1206900 [compost metagenome]